MDRYMRNLQTLRRCQLAYDNMLPPEYWKGCDEDWDTDEESEI